MQLICFMVFNIRMPAIYVTKDNMCPWTTKPVLIRWGIFVAIAKKHMAIPWTMFHAVFCKFPTVNIPKLNFWLVICVAKDFSWTSLKVIFSIFRFFLHPQMPDFQSVVSQPNIAFIPCMVQTIHQWKVDLYSFQMMNKSKFRRNWPLWLVLWSRDTYLNYTAFQVHII